ncbi:23S rRNA (pseudouridine(1915)-N(3))-methyltransferase RlmH [Bifidobacterium gallicum]|uniref:Ribosomal RNA large subunit methyltransferase H n=1 Tax=Bifidobacterium gallicum DSM 20093 = LMG 11596 TaxID=561180 RepID=D1NUU5_9BIFI|nr:23S rRNA (pseudouridine(1915)-N(3))-methyltransferase RlmH [Bifidobacterium gallicum]EFA22596.1 rRNA large subunit m3Psi methyltransferase RlmH [Bifidobacterium gallicum DSM 20093 = LMG 11596]KFI59578.1 50S rRNA methyltransferase [Bifidobacterium gallicum DSM 20093 = LMG 11596]
MNITILTVGKIKERYLRDAIDEYAKRMSRFCKLQIMQVNDEKTPEHASAAEELQIKQREGERLMAHIKPQSTVIALAIEGRMLTSEQLAHEIEEFGLRGHSNLVFVIGGSLGLDPRILKRADMLLSFSRMTFPHQLMRVILLEQLYRAYKINAGEPYHK